MMTIGQLLDMFVVTHLLPNSLTDGALSLTHLVTHPPIHSPTHSLTNSPSHFEQVGGVQQHAHP